MTVLSDHRAGAGMAAGEATVRHISPEAWDGMVAGFRDAVHEQTAVYNAARWGGSRVSCFTVERAGAVLGGGVAVTVRLPLLDRGLSIVKFGPLHRQGTQAPGDTLAVILRALRDEFAGRRRHHLTVTPLTGPDDAALWEESLRAAGFAHWRPAPDPARYLVDLSLDPDAQRANLHGKWRYNLRKAEAAGLEIRRVEGAEGLETFMALYEAMLARKRFDDTSGIGALPALMAARDEAIRPEIYLASLDGGPTAGAVIGRLGERAMYLFGATDGRALAAKAGYALHWHIIGALTESGARWYDLGGTAGDAGLHQFKKQLVGRAGAIVDLPGDYVACDSALSGALAHGVHGLRGLAARLRR